MYANLLTNTDLSLLESELNEFLKFIEDKGWELLHVIKCYKSHIPKIKKGKPLFFSIIVIFEEKNAS
jgi:hypothetical protein